MPLADEQGREWFWRTIISKYDIRIRRYALRARCTSDELDDIVADVWAEAASTEALLQQAVDVWPVLQTVARRVMADRMRQRRHDRSVQIDLCTERDIGSLEGQSLFIEPRSRQVHLDRLLAGLAPQQRAAVEYRYIWGWPYWAVAAALGVSDVTARVHVAATLKNLRSALATAKNSAD